MIHTFSVFFLSFKYESFFYFVLKISYVHKYFIYFFVYYIILYFFISLLNKIINLLLLLLLLKFYGIYFFGKGGDFDFKETVTGLDRNFLLFLHSNTFLFCFYKIYSNYFSRNYSIIIDLLKL